MDLVIFPELAREAIRQKKSKPLWLWTVLRALDRNGQGWVAIKDIKATWHQSDKNLLRIINEGRGEWWTEGKGKLFLFSSFKVALSLESTLGKPTVYSFEDCSTIGKFKARCFAAWFWKERTISVGSLERLFGVTGQTIRVWSRLGKLKIQTNIVRYDIPKEGIEIQGDGVWFSNGFCYFQIPNTYCNDCTTCPRHRRTEKRLRQTLNLDRGQYQRIYHQSGGSACRAIQAGQRHTFIKTQEPWGAATIWEYYAQ